MSLEIFVNQIVWGLLIGVSYSLLAIGYSIIYASTDAINFAQGEYAMLGAYLCYTIMANMGANIIIAALLALALTFLFGALVERIAFRRLYNLDHVYIVICTIGLSMILKNVVLLIWGALPKSLPIDFEIAPIMLGKVMLFPKNLILLAVGIFCMVIFHLYMTKTKMGTAMRAVAQNKRSASLMGINVKRSINFTWGLGALIAGVGGILLAFTYNLSIDMGALISLKGFAGAILGGFGNVVGSMFGGLILGLSENMGAFLISYDYKDIIAFVFIIIILLVKPSGLFIKGKAIRKI